MSTKLASTLFCFGVAPRHVPNQKSAPLARALGQINRPFSKADQGYVLVCCVCCALGVVASQELKFLWDTGLEALLAIRTKQGVYPGGQPPKLRHQMHVHTALWEILVLWSTEEGECADRTCPPRSLERLTVSPTKISE